MSLPSAARASSCFVLVEVSKKGVGDCIASIHAELSTGTQHLVDYTEVVGDPGLLQVCVVPASTVVNKPLAESE